MVKKYNDYTPLSTFRCEAEGFEVSSYSVKINLPAQQYNTVIQHSGVYSSENKVRTDHLAIKILLEQEFRIKLFTFVFRFHGISIKNTRMNTGTNYFTYKRSKILF